MRPWNDDRPRTRRVVLSETMAATRGLSLKFATDQTHTTTDCCCRHLARLHRAGQLHSTETDLTPSQRTLLGVGDIRVAPTAGKGASVAEGDTAECCGIAVPTHLLAATTLMPPVKHCNPLIHQIVERISAVADRDDARARLLTDSLAETLKLVITDMCARSPARATEPRRDTLDPPTRTKLIEFLEDNIDSTITLDMLARQAEMTVPVFLTAFRAAFHTTPYQYLLDRRFERAKFLLRNTERTVAEIGAMAGFSTPSHFSTAFRRRVGVSPRVYRGHR